MITVRQGGKVYGAGVFMFECEAAEVKAALLAYGTKAAKRMADEIGMPSDGVSYPHGGETSRETVQDVLDEMRNMGNYQSFSGDHAAKLAMRISNAILRERALNIGGDFNT